jgi:N-acetylmuramate 1-kinase
MSLDAQRQIERTSYVASQGYDPMRVEALPVDASARSYCRLSGGEAPRLLMDTPPGSPDFMPFISIARHLRSLGFSAPRIDSFDDARGFAILEDFGHNTFKRLLDDGQDEEALYKLAVDTLIALHETPRASQINVPAYGMEPLVSELEMFTDWYAPMMLGGRNQSVFKKEFIDLWCDALNECSTSRETLVLRDFHVDNLMVIAGRSDVASCGLLDFQDALIGSAAYDLVSLLQDARRDLSPGLEDDLLNYYLIKRPSIDATQFLQTYWLLGAHRHTKVAGNFERLSKRDGKHGYLVHIPRVLKLLDRAMDKAMLSDIRRCLDLHIPDWKNWPHARS